MQVSAALSCVLPWPIMDKPAEQGKFKSWRQALEQGILSADQIAVLDDMVKQGQADTLEAAASILDWQDAIINKPDHMYGF